MRSVETSLSRMWKVGRSPAALSFLMIAVTAMIWLDFSCFSWVLRTHDWVVVISAEDALVSLGGWDKEPTSGVRVNFPCGFLTGKLKMCGSLFDWCREIALGSDSL